MRNEYGELDLEVEFQVDEFQSDIKFLVKFYHELNPIKLFIGTNEEKNQSLTDYKYIYKKMFLKYHPDKSSNPYPEMCTKLSNSNILITQLHENHHNQYSSDTSFVEIVNLLCKLRDLEDYLDICFLKSPFDKDSLKSSIKKAMLKKDKAETMKQKLITESTTLIRLQIVNFTNDFFIISEYNEYTPYGGPTPQCPLQNCSSNNNFFAILPCCNTLVKRDCLVESIYNEITANNCRDNLYAFSVANCFQWEIKCPLCSYKLLDEPVEIKRYQISENITKSRNDIIFNKVFFLMKNQRRNDKIKSDNEINNLLNENITLSNKIKLLVDFCKERDSDIVQQQSSSFSSHDNTDNEISMSMSNSELNVSAIPFTDQEETNNDNNTSYDNSSDISITQSPFCDEPIDTFPDDTLHDNNLLPDRDWMNAKNVAFVKMIISEVIQTKRSKNDSKYYPIIYRQNEQKMWLRCPFFPTCKKELELSKSENSNSVKHGGRVQGKFRRHTCKGCNKDKIFISLKHLRFEEI